MQAGSLRARLCLDLDGLGIIALENTAYSVLLPNKLQCFRPNSQTPSVDRPTLTTRILLQCDEGEWIAHSLELDLVGTGENKEDAIQDLVGAIVTQVEFCQEKGWDSFFPAPEEVFQMWEKIQLEAWETVLAHAQRKDQDYRYASSLNFSLSDSNQGKRLKILQMA